MSDNNLDYTPGDDTFKADVPGDMPSNVKKVYHILGELNALSAETFFKVLAETAVVDPLNICRQVKKNDLIETYGGDYARYFGRPYRIVDAYMYLPVGIEGGAHCGEIRINIATNDIQYIGYVEGDQNKVKEIHEEPAYSIEATFHEKEPEENKRYIMRVFREGVDAIHDLYRQTSSL